MINKDVYRVFSVRSRVAYTLVCLDLMCDKYKINKTEREYKYLTNSCWFFIGPRCDKREFFDFFMDQSYGLIIKWPTKDLITNEWRTFIPMDVERGIMEIANETIDGFKYDIPVLENKKSILENYYLSLPIEIAELFNYLHEIFVDGYDGGGDGNNDSFNTLHYLNLIIQLLIKDKVEPPPLEPFLFSKFADNYGFGSTISKREIEEALGMKL